MTGFWAPIGKSHFIDIYLENEKGIRAELERSNVPFTEGVTRKSFFREGCEIEAQNDFNIIICQRSHEK